MTVPSLNLPNFPGGQSPGERRVLANSLTVFRFRCQGCSNFIDGPTQQLFPFRVTAQKGRNIAIPLLPPLNVGARQI